MTYQQGIAAGRRDVIAQIERGLDRRRAPSARVLMVPGPGGSGKKCLLGVVEADTRAELPCARLVLSPAQDVRLAVERVADAMDGFESKRYGTLSLPRVTLLRSLASRVRAEAEPPDDYRRRQLAKDALIGPRTVSGTDAAAAAPDLLDPGDGIPNSRIGVFIANLAMRAWRSRRRGALALGRPGRVLAPRRAGVWRWYENYGDRSDDFAGGGVVGFAAAAAREMSEASRGATPDARDSARHRLDRLWVAALVADLFGAYPRRRPYRRLRCLLLLEDADLLVSDDNLSPLTGHPLREAGQGGDLLNLMQTEIETFAGRRTRCPVLIVATQQAAAGQIEGGSTLELLPMTRAQATSFVAATAPQRPLTAWAQEELFDACKGHPLALHLLLEQRDRQRQEVVRPPRAKPALGRPQPGGAEPLTEVLLDSFLQRFEPEPTRTEITNLLTLVAIPRRVSVPALRALALDGVPAPWPLFRLLRSYSFTQIVQGADEPTIELDPLMRDLLMRRGHEASGELAAAVRARRELLRDTALGGANTTLDALHHHLALGETDAVAALLARYPVGTWDDELFDEIDDACRAPGAPEDPALPSDDDAMAYVLATWALRSCTSTARWSRNRFLDLSRRAAVLGPNTSASIRLTEFAERDVDPNASGSRGRPFRYPPQLLLARRRFLALAVAVPVALAGGTVAVEVDSAEHWCDLDPVSAFTVRFDDRLRLERVGDECIGVTASAVSFSASAREPSPEEREITELATAIEGQNRDAESAQQEARPIVTIVVATMLSSGGESGDGSVAAGVNELRGALLAQRRANEPSGAISKRFRVRLLLANLGGNSRYATQTADAIVAHARDDLGIVGVTGMGQTRAETIAAAQILGGAGIPMVGSAPSGDAFENSPYFIRLAPSNERQGQIIAEVTRTAFPDHRPFLLWDAGADTYSSELKDDMDRAFMERGTGPLRLLDYRAGDVDVAGTIEGRLRQLCTEAGLTPALLLYSGRANELPTVLDRLRTVPCANNVRILAGDDLTQLVTQGFRLLHQELSDRLYYSTFGRGVDGPARPQELVDFAEEYATAEAKYPGGFTTGANGHTMLAHDALTLLFDAALATAAPAGAPPSRSDVFPVARATNRRMVTGNVGLVPFGPSPTAGAEVPDKLVVVQEIFSLPAGGYAERELSRGPAAYGG